MTAHGLSRRAQGLPRSGVREAMARAAQAPGAIRLDIGDPDFPTPAHVVDAACRAAAAGDTHYGPAQGLPSLRALIAEKVASRNGFSCREDQVVVTAGGCGALFLCFLALLDPGDTVLVPDPGWSHYVPMAFAVGALPVRYPLERGEGFQPDLEALEALIDARTRAIVINSPANPTGALLERQTLLQLVEMADKNDVWLVSDECYDELVLEGEHVSAAPFEAESGW